jgi:hypothetical protein
VNPTEEQALSQRLHEEIGSFTVPPAPVGAVRRHGRAIKTRRRAYAAGATALAVAVAVVSLQAIPGATPARPPALVSPPGQVFASGVTNGKPWKLGVRNVAANPGTRWCLPAVMVNGHDGAILDGSTSSGGSGLLDMGDAGSIAGLPGLAFVFITVSAHVTRVVYHLPGERPVKPRLVAVTECGTRFRLAGFAYTKGGVASVTTYSGHRHWFGRFPMSGATHARGDVQAVADADIWSIVPQSVRAAQIASGMVGHVSWTITEMLTSAGQGYIGSAGGVNGRDLSRFGTIEAPPSGATLSQVRFPGAAANQLTGYAGLVSPRTAYAVASLSNGATRTLTPLNVGGRVYLALAVPHGVTLTQLVLHDHARQAFASVPGPSPAG